MTPQTRRRDVALFREHCSFQESKAGPSLDLWAREKFRWISVVPEVSSIFESKYLRRCRWHEGKLARSSTDGHVRAIRPEDKCQSRLQVNVKSRFRDVRAREQPISRNIPLLQNGDVDHRILEVRNSFSVHELGHWHSRFCCDSQQQFTRSGAKKSGPRSGLR